MFSLRMVLDESDHAESTGSTDPGQRALSLAIYPLSVPLLVTPPAIASLIALGVIARVDDVAQIRGSKIDREYRFAGDHIARIRVDIDMACCPHSMRRMRQCDLFNRL